MTVTTTTTNANLKLEQEQRIYDYDTGKEKGSAILRILYPSQPHGVWPGTSITIREWRKCPKESMGAYVECSREEIIEFEEMLGELEEVKFTGHPTLGLVSYGPLKQEKKN